ncbi:hypothetical protein DSO57_1016590 [Entomophthora muscae]|uniref:Uncharacterized protein n=1 Tax=Entomophthora muscae TaxID=34485 RepID=A0ACC2TSG2_9FUNG|nr:hypothetical protein DSO57_1016590 [Entomophthora muscae]
MVLNPWTPLASSLPTLNLATYVIPAAMLLYLAVSLRQCNILAKAFCQAVNFYPTVYALNSFELPNLPSYVTKVLPSILGYYIDPQTSKVSLVFSGYFVKACFFTKKSLNLLYASENAVPSAEVCGLHPSCHGPYQSLAGLP